MNTQKLYCALVHYPIKNKRGDKVATSVTNLDIHDISRSSKTFGFENFFIVTPIEKQAGLVNKILGHWETEEGTDYNPDRSEALENTLVKSSLESSIAFVKEKNGVEPLVVLTGANFTHSDGDEKKLIELAKVDERPILLVFGTGWGLHSELDDLCSFRLNPIIGHTDYNHLSVRSAVAIYMSRLSALL